MYLGDNEVTDMSMLQLSKHYSLDNRVHHQVFDENPGIAVVVEGNDLPYVFVTRSDNDGLKTGSLFKYPVCGSF